MSKFHDQFVFARIIHRLLVQKIHKNINNLCNLISLVYKIVLN